jgi:hypothetical protein
VFVGAVAFAWQAFRPAATSIGSSSPTPRPGMSVYTDPLGWTAFYPSDWSVTTLQQTSDGLGAGVRIQNLAFMQTSPIQDGVVLTVTHPLGATPDPSADSSSFPLSASDFTVSPGASNASVLQFRVDGVQYLATLTVGSAARSADVTAMDEVIASIRPSGAEPSPALSALTTESFPVGSQPSSLAAADGWVWVAEDQANSVEKVDPATGRVVDSIALSGRAEWLEGGSGYMYAGTYSQADGSNIQVFDSSTDRRVGTFQGLTGPLVLEADGLWAVSPNRVAETNDVVLVDLTTGQILRRFPVAGAPIDMVAAAPGSVWVQPLVSGLGKDVAIRISTTPTDAVTPIDGASAGIWLASNEDGVWLSAWVPGRHATSAFVDASGSEPQPFGSIYNFRPMTVADGRVWFVAGPGDGPIQGVCGLRIDTQAVDECADVSVADLEATRQPVAFDSTTDTLWVSAYGRSAITRVTLQGG